MLIVKRFDQLNTRELYEILKARSEIFVVEQNCVYQDLDGIDYDALHCYYEEEGRITAYLRAFDSRTEADTVQVGRVMTLTHGQGLGGRLLHESLEVIKREYHPSRIYLEA